MKYIYIFRNLINEKVYVGQTYNPTQRKAGHLCAMQNPSNDYLLPRAMRKHGYENFRFEIIEECTDELVNEREKFWIAHYDSTNRDKGYNLSKGGQTHSQESRRKLSQALKGNTHCVGRQLSRETRDKLRKCGPAKAQSQLGSVITEQRTCKCGKTFEVTFREKQKKQGNVHCSQSCANRKPQSETTRAKTSASLQKRFINSIDHFSEIKDAIIEGATLVSLHKQYDISYSTLKRIKKLIQT